MKTLKKTFIGFFAVAIIALSTGCYGSFSLTNKVYDVNMDMGDMWVKEIVFLAFNIIPVYGFTFFIDGIVLNSIEFWTGDNPLSLKEGEMEKKIVESNGIAYEITATYQNYQVVQLNGQETGKTVNFSYNAEENGWYANDGIHYTKVCDGKHFKTKKHLTAGSTANVAAK